MLDANGRIPPFYLANGSVHVRLTDASGVVQFDVPSMLVVGPSSSGGGGGGSGVDPTTIAATGDIKFRPTSDVITGWVRLNGLTIGSAVSGSTERANADTQALFVYLWGVCTNAHCPVSSGRGSSGLADFQANKQLTLPDMRSRTFFGNDSMGNSAAGRILSSNITSGGGDTPTTPGASGGESNHTLLLAEAPNGQFTLNDPGHSHTVPGVYENAGLTLQGGAACCAVTTATTSTNTTGITLTDHSGGGAHNTMPPFMLGTYYAKL